jgi:anti-sigma factor RsiW
LRSAFVDDALSPHDRERLLVHMVGCGACRSDVDELRTIRRLLSGSRPRQATASGDLSQRLTSIAGPQAADPLWSRPFRRTSPGMLPSERHIRRLRLGAAGLAVGALVTTAVGVGYAAAPVPSLALINDPSADAQAEFTSMLTQSPLVSDSIGAVMLAGTERLASARGLPQPARQDVKSESSLTSAEARGALVRASAAASRFSYTGTQVFTALLDGTTVSAVIQIDSRGEQGSQLTVINERAEKVLTGYARPAVTSRMADNQLLGLLERNYRVSGSSGSTVAGRPATVVQASKGGVVAARWWIDDATGLLLGQETYDEQGQLILSSRFASIRIGNTSAILKHLPPRLGVSTTTSALTVSSSPQLTAQGWSCADSVAGLALVRVRTDRASSPHVLHLVYSDGLNTVSVFQRRGMLAAPPQGAPWDKGLGAYVGAAHAPGLATWQSGTTVYTVITDGSTQLLADVVRALPHEPLSSPTTMERVQAGWADILSRLKR